MEASHSNRQSILPALEIRQVLVALDRGGESDGAVVRGLELARLFDAGLMLVHALEVPPSLWRLRSDPTATAGVVLPAASARARVVHRVGDLLQLAGHPRSRAEELVRITAGHPAKVLVESARASQADLIMLGSLRKQRMFDLGSTARGVLAKAPCAVWVQRESPTAIRRILVAVDFSEDSNLALGSAIELARRTGAHVRALHVFDPRPFAMADWYTVGNFASLEEARAATADAFDAFLSEIDWKGVERDWVMVVGTPASQILEQCESTDLVVLGTHGRSGFASAVLGSVAYSVLVRAGPPVLTVRKPPENSAHG